MKNIFSFKNLGLFLCSCLAVSCSEDETTPVTIGDFQVLTPDLEVTISYTDTDPGEYVDLSWDRAKASDGTTVFYEVQFAGKDKNFDTPAMTITPDKLCYANVVQLSQQQMNIVAERTGIRPLQTGEIYWRVRAITGLVEHVNSTVRTIKVTRQGGFAETPKAIFVYGEATGQSDIAGAIPLKQTTDSVYEGFMKLGNGTYSFVNAKEGDIVEMMSSAGLPANAIISPFVQKILDDNPDKPTHCVKCLKKCTYKFCVNERLVRGHNGDYEGGIFFAGKDAWKINEILSVHEIFNRFKKVFKE